MFQKEGETNETGYLQGVDGIWWKERIFLYALTLIAIFYLLIYLFICVAASGVSCSVRDLQSSLWYVGSSSLTPAPCIRSRVLAAGPPETSQHLKVLILVLIFFSCKDSFSSRSS